MPIAAQTRPRRRRAVRIEAVGICGSGRLARTPQFLASDLARHLAVGTGETARCETTHPEHGDALSAANRECNRKLIATMEAEPLDDASLVATATAVDDSSPPEAVAVVSAVPLAPAEAAHPSAAGLSIATAGMSWEHGGDFEVDEAWSGLRPTTVDGAPVLGRTRWTNLWVCGGYWRNGILLAPAAAELLADAMDGALSAEGARLLDACRSGPRKGATFPTSKAHISAVFHSFGLIFGRAVISRNGLEAWMLFSERARAEHSR